ncbi:MAG TPA: DinB family protein [bacterium]|jgi:uncharacterized damage-inducible protein DinB|nr:DinB family protein [bacterium]
MPSQSLADWLRARVDRTYRRGNWAGPGPLRAIRGITPATAHWRPHSDQHTIAEITRHMGYWKDAVEARLAGRAWTYDRSANWRPVAPTARGWADARSELAAAHRRLMRALERTNDADLLAPAKAVDPRRLRWRMLDFVVDVATHDSYHAAQIFVLRRLAPGHARTRSRR